MSPSWFPFGGYLGPKMATEIVSRMCFQRVHAQLSFKKAPRGPRRPKKGPQKESKGPPEAPKWIQKGSKRAARGSQEGLYKLERPGTVIKKFSGAYRLAD